MGKLNNWKKYQLIFMMMLLTICILSMGITTDAARNKFVKKSGKIYYYDSKGKKTKGLKKIKAKYYYFDSRGIRFQKGWKTIKGKKYYFAKSNGAAFTGLKKIGSKSYLFSASGKRYGSGIVRFQGKTYYVKNGRVEKGWKKVKGKRYYFNSNGAASTGWVTYKKKQYYFDSKGVMQKNKWVGNKYLGHKGYVTKIKNNQPVPIPTPNPIPTPEPTPEPIPDPIPDPETSGYIYNETISTQIFNDINAFRVANGKPALKRAMNTLLKYSIIRGSESITNNLKTGVVEDLATHGGGQIGLGSNGSPFKLVGQDISTGNLNAIDIWAKSPMHRSNILNDNDLMAVAVMYTTTYAYSVDGKTRFTNYHTSVIVSFGRISKATYSIGEINQGRYNPDAAPMYGFVIHYTDQDFNVSKEYIANTDLEVPFEKWDIYLKCRLEK